MPEPSTPPTIRSLLEQIARWDWAESDYTGPEDRGIDAAIKRAVAALELLNNASYQRRDGFPSTRYALVRDPMHPHDDPEAAS